MELISTRTGWSTLFLQIPPGEFPVTDVTILAVIILFLLLITAIAAGAEAAYFSLSVKDLNYLKTKEQQSARQAIALLEQPKMLLATIIVANNFINIAIVITSSLLIRVILEYAYALNIGEIIDRYSFIYYAVQILSIGLVLVLFGSVMPRVYAMHNNIRMVLFAAPVLKFLTWLFGPVSKMLVSSSSYLEEKMGQRNSMLSGEHFEQAIEQTVGHTATEEEVNIFRGILKFGNISVRQIMRTRLDISAVPYTISFPQVQQIAINAGYSRIPVYAGNMDSIKGIIYTRDFMPHLDDPDFNWHSLIRPAYFVHESKPIDDLLKEFQHKRTHLAIVVDEFGGTSGIVTLEDIIEEIIGEIRDELDEEELEFTKIDENNFIFEGKTPMNDVCRAAGISSETFREIRGNSGSLAGLILEIAGKFPALNETVSFKEYDFTILETDRTRIKRVRLTINTNQQDALQ